MGDNFNPNRPQYPAVTVVVFPDLDLVSWVLRHFDHPEHADGLTVHKVPAGTDTPFKVADLTLPLPYDDEAFDDALAVLVLHYLKDWSRPLAELRRVLKLGGRLVVVVNHPVIPKVMYPEIDYFATVPNEEEYDFDGVSATLRIWYRSLSAMSESFSAAAFRIAAISEPPVSPDTPPELLPPSKTDPTRFIGFIFFTLEAVS